MRTAVFNTGLALVAWFLAGCVAPSSITRPSPSEVKQAVSVAFGLQPDAALDAVIEKVRSDLSPESSPDQVIAYLDAVKKRSPAMASIQRTKRVKWTPSFGQENRES